MPMLGTPKVTFSQTYEVMRVQSLGASGTATPAPFEMTISGTTATFTNCVYQRQMCFITATDKTATLVMTGDYYVGYIVDEAAGTITMNPGADFSDVAHTTPPADQSAIKIPLYKLTDGRVVCDYRKTTQVGLYI